MWMISSWLGDVFLDIQDEYYQPFWWGSRGRGVGSWSRMDGTWRWSTGFGPDSGADFQSIKFHLLMGMSLLFPFPFSFVCVFTALLVVSISALNSCCLLSVNYITISSLCLSQLVLFLSPKLLLKGLLCFLSWLKKVGQVASVCYPGQPVSCNN